MLHKIKIFFIELREKDEAAKKRWLVVLTSVSMVFVAALWGINLNMSIQDLGGRAQRVEKENFMAVIKNGADMISKGTGLKLSKLADSVQAIANKTNSITINKTDNDVFIKKDLEQISPKKLP